MNDKLNYIPLTEAELNQIREQAEPALLLQPAGRVNPYKESLMLCKKILGDWALIELTRKTLPQAENLQINRALLDAIHRHDRQPMIVSGHWEDDSCERFFCIVREQTESMEEFRTLVAACVTADTSGSTCAVVHSGSRIRERYGCLYPITAEHYNKENSIVRPDGSWQTFDNICVNDLYACEIGATECSFVFDGVEEPVSAEERERFEQAGIAYPVIRICRM